MHEWKVSVEFDVTLYSGHSYGVDSDGRGVPSVTQLVNPSSGFHGVTSAMDRGTRIHQALEEVVAIRNSGAVIRKYHCGSEDIRDDVHQLAMHWQRKVHQPYAQAIAEQRFICTLTRGDESYSYAGTIDLVETLGGKVVLCADWKSGGKHRWHRLQLACYMHAIGAPSGAIIYPSGVDWVAPISSEEIVDLIRTYHARQKLASDKKKVMAGKISRWQRGQAYA